MKDLPKTPALDKMASVRNESQKIGEFLEYLGQRRIILCEETDPPLSYDAPYMPVNQDTEQLLADFFEIDLKACEEERRAILKAIQEKGSK